VYACFGIFFISCLSKVTLILRHLWKTKFQGMLMSPCCADGWCGAPTFPDSIKNKN
jgi:hypothetical protein